MSPAFQRASRVALVVGLIGLAASAVGGWASPRAFLFPWLWAVLFVLGLSLGSAAVVMIHHLSGGAWGWPLRSTLEAAASVLPLVALLFLPVFLGLELLYPWARPALVAASEVLQRRQPYMSETWFILRAFICFAIWILIVLRLLRLSDRQAARDLRWMSGPALCAYPVVGTIAFLDWIVSLDEHWFSTMFMALVCVGQLLSGYAFVLLMVLVLKPEPIARLLTPKLLNQLGNLLLAFVLLWTYMAFSQFLIIWNGNLPHEISWYRHRVDGGWKWVLVSIAAFHFGVPFVILLSREAKRRSAILAGVAAAVVAAHLVYDYWMILPAVPALEMPWLHLSVPLGVGGIWFWWFARQMSRRPLLPSHE